MKKVVVKIIQTFNKMYNWLKQKDRFDNQRSATILLGGFLSSGVAIYYVDNPKVQKVIGFSFMFLFFVIINVFRFDTSDKIISKLTKNVCNTPRELLKRLNHVSYAYGLFWFSLQTCVFIEVFIFLLTGMVCNEPIVILEVTNLWISSMFVYTLFYFAYHIYFADSKEKIELVKQRIQLYAAIGTTISFLMLLFGESREFKIFVVGTMLEYTWLQYFITEELNELKDN